MATFLGLDCKLYYSATLLDGASNTVSTVTWTLVANVQGVNVALDKDQIDVSTRDNSGFKQYAVGLKDATMNATIKYDSDHATWTAMKDAWLNNTILAFWAAEATEASGTQGPATNAYIKNFSLSQDLNGALITTFDIVPESFTEWATHS